MHDRKLHPKIIALDQKLKEKNFLATIKYQIEQKVGEKITLGCEIEFYLKNYHYEKLRQLLPNYNFIRERGESQIEYHIGPLDNHEQFLDLIETSISEITKAVTHAGGQVSFHPLPFINDYGNSLQFQIASSSSIFQDQIENISMAFCHYAEASFLAYASTEQDYLRFKPGFMAPSHISYGYNNRSCLIRINGDNPKRIEIRAPSPYCNLSVVLSTILKTIDKGLNEQFDGKKYPKIFGNSYDLQYNLKTVPLTLKQSAELFDEKFYF